MIILLNAPLTYLPHSNLLFLSIPLYLFKLQPKHLKLSTLFNFQPRNKNSLCEFPLSAEETWIHQHSYSIFVSHIRQIFHIACKSFDNYNKTVSCMYIFLLSPSILTSLSSSPYSLTKIIHSNTSDPCLTPLKPYTGSNSFSYISDILKSKPYLLRFRYFQNQWFV